MGRQLYEAQKRIEGRIVTEMEKDEATKMKYNDVKGEEKTITLKEGTLKQAVKEPEAIIKENGFEKKKNILVFMNFQWNRFEKLTM